MKKIKVKNVLGVALMLLLGVMRVISGWFWVSRPDPPGYLEDALTTAMEEGGTVGFYKTFLTGFVIANKGLFAILVGWGELLTGLSFVTGTLVKVSAWVFIFMLANYALMNGAFLQHLVLIALNVLVIFMRPSEVFGFDKRLRMSWPNSKLL